MGRLLYTLLVAVFPGSYALYVIWITLFLLTDLLGLPVLRLPAFGILGLSCITRILWIQYRLNPLRA